MNNMATRSATLGVRFIRRGMHTTSARRGAAPAPWGSEVNEPGGRLFGEKILAEGERRVAYDWEAPYLGTLALAGVMLYFGLGARPNTDLNVWAREEAIERMRKREEEAN